MLQKIEVKYKIYNDIFNNLEHESNSTVKTLIENSLYLSVFTVFEDFLKNLIKNYLDNISKKGIKFTQLSNGLAYKIFLDNEKRINNIFNGSEKKKENAFDSYFKLIKNDLSKEELAKYIHFEFLHEGKLNGYYKDLFEQIIGEREILTNLKLKEECNDFDGLIEIQGDAYTFLREYTVKVRNNIAHDMQLFKVDGFTSFNKITDAFLFIMQELKKIYEKHNGFELKENENNLLSEF